MSKESINCQISKTTYETVQVGFKEQIRITEGIIRQVYGLGKGEEIDVNRNLTWWEDTHGSGIDHIIRKATNDDVLALEILKHIREWKIQQ